MPFVFPPPTPYFFPHRISSQRSSAIRHRLHSTVFHPPFVNVRLPFLSSYFVFRISSVRISSHAIFRISYFVVFAQRSSVLRGLRKPCSSASCSSSSQRHVLRLHTPFSQAFSPSFSSHKHYRSTCFRQLQDSNHHRLI